MLRLTRLKAFFRFAVTADWIATSPAKGLRPPKPDTPPTMPLTNEDFRSLLEAAADMPRERALLMMRYSGLAIGDAVTLSRGALQGGLLRMRRTKSGEFVICPLPSAVVEALGQVAHGGGYFFWAGVSARETVSKYWERRLRRVAALAGITGFRSHRLRDTFGVRLLVGELSMQ